MTQSEDAKLFLVVPSGREESPVGEFLGCDGCGGGCSTEIAPVNRVEVVLAGDDRA